MIVIVALLIANEVLEVLSRVRLSIGINLLQSIGGFIFWFLCLVVAYPEMKRAGRDRAALKTSGELIEDGEDEETDDPGAFKVAPTGKVIIATQTMSNSEDLKDPIDYRI